MSGAPTPVASDETEGDESHTDDAADAVDEALDSLDAGNPEVDVEPDADTGPESAPEPDDVAQQSNEVDPGPFDAVEEPDDEDIDIDLADTDVGEDVGDGPFDGEDGRGGGANANDAGAGGSEYGGGAAGAAAAMGQAGESLADTINEGCARAAVIGLDDEFEHNGSLKTKNDLEAEFKETFETFKLGKYGAEAAEEYLDVAGGEVDPLWGFTASLLICAVLVVQMRPDSDELTQKARATLSNIGGSN